MLRALRGATTVDDDIPEQIHDRVVVLLEEMFARNEIDHDDLVSIVFTATDDVRSAFPATAARTIGLGDVPMLCARELDIVDSTPRCIRVLVHVDTTRDRADLRHVYLEGASRLRDDLPG
ncbi:MAG: chorismate mutase [Actinobacteria bacterium]|nr:chorismate mutase [Actinomycetota bacterium]MBW3641390.1 chorismate mutase [Actinomycetota bacterium]